MQYSSLVAFTALATSVLAYDNSRNDNVAVYWGQNSYGAANGADRPNWQQTVSHYCQDDSIDVLPVSFVTVFFGAGGLPQINLANICNEVDNSTFPGTALANCQSLAEDIKQCQSRGKILPMSLGGATGAIGFTSDQQVAEEFATTVWNVFLGGSSDTRPFGDAVLDGVDLDIEGGSPNHYTAFVNKLREYYAGGDKPYYVFAAPQCPYPDHYLSDVLNNAHFDAVYVQFYNNYCGLSGTFNWADWENWALNTSPNKNVKVYIGAPASPTAANNGFVDIGRLSALATQTQASPVFGGVMLWDASQALANNRFDQAIKNALTGGSSLGPSGPSSSPAPEPPATSPQSCTGAENWSEEEGYKQGSTAQKDGRLYEAKWGSAGQAPGSAGVWQDLGECKAESKGAHPRDFRV